MLHTSPSSSHRGFTLAEVLMVVAIMGTLFVITAPKITELKARTALRASHETLESAFATARASAMQKGKRSTLTLSGNTVGVTVLSGLTNTATQVVRPLLFASTFGTTVAAIGAAPTTIAFDARGLVTPVSATIAKYQITLGSFADTVCVSGAGVVLRRGCRL
ncbi:prepilin-type N-terminal cleavage/methylation domain-containing protein [Gemmatimonas groenlandica]|uniref:Type II secretion system protein H n=1 Tax=Gemmatimonas groenlandica TaxID=2732249 RepID=A0A6M4INM0_9BACT|nr:prepilin-type N-terminal cleavage/methylation domain-containing protein [Gemmatimonas groenlandica]